MENIEQVPAHPSEELQIPSHSHSHHQVLKVLLIVVIMLVILISGFGGYILGKKNQVTNTQTIVPSPTRTQAVTSPMPLPSNCTTDTECPSGYGCQALQGQGTACPVSNNAVINCTPTYSITKGECRLKRDGICSNDNNCMAGLICHDISPNTSGYQIKKCEEPTLGTCSGASGKSCPAGYQCTEGCGPPIIGGGENNTIPWNCTANEIAGRPRGCPICLASNTMIATPQGYMNVTAIKIGMRVLSVNKKGAKIVSKVIQVGNTTAPNNHKVVHLVLSDGRNLWVSPNHPTATGAVVGNLKIGESYDHARIVQLQLVHYCDTKTYDILPDSETGFYYANSILLGSTLK